MIFRKISTHFVRDCSKLVTAQQQDLAIARILHFKHISQCPVPQEQQSEPVTTRQLLQEWNRLIITKYGILYHKTWSQNRVVLSEKYHKRVYEDLNENMGHLAAGRLVELARERFYWLFMKADIYHCVSRVCQCLKQRKPPTLHSILLLYCASEKSLTREYSTRKTFSPLRRKLLFHGIHPGPYRGRTEFVSEGNHATPIRFITSTTKGLMTLTMGKTIRPKRHLEAHVFCYGSSDAVFNPMAFTMNFSSDVHSQPDPTSNLKSGIPVILL